MGESSPPVGQRQMSRPRTDVELRRTSAEDVHRLKAVLAAAFYGDPIIGWMMPDEHSAALYARLGFQPTDELRVAGSPPLWPMLRSPGPPADSP